MLVLNAYQIVMATQQDISARHCVIIQLPCCDEEAILKYLYEHVHVYSWILREDKETEMVRLCVFGGGKSSMNNFLLHPYVRSLSG